MLKSIAVTTTLIALIAAPGLALAQAPPPGLGWVRGTVAKLDGEALTIKTKGGADTAVTLTDKTRVNTLVKKSVADIKPGDFLASAGVKGTDGKIHAVEVRILPQAMPNGGGQFDWDLGAGSVMTNALVGTVTKSPQGEVVHVTFKGGESAYSIGPDVPILAPAPGDKSLLKPGAAVVAFGPKKPGGGLTAAAVYAEKDGIKPPM